MSKMSAFKKIPQDGWLTTKKERRYLVVGEIGRLCLGAIVTALMTLFLVFQGIDLRLIAGVMLAVRIIDSVNDVAIGYLVDRVKINEWKLFKKIAGEGKYLPWFRATFVLFPIFTILFFLMPIDLSTTGKLIWFAVFFLLYDFSFTFVEVPSNSLMVTITDNPDERNNIIQYRSIFGMLGFVLIQVIWTFLISEVIGIPIRTVAIVSAVAFFALLIPLATKVKEHNTELKSVEVKGNNRYSLKDMFNAVRKNRYLMLLLLSIILMNGLATGGQLGLLVSYYRFNSSLILAIPIFIAMIPQLIAQMQTAKLVKRFGKIKVLVSTGMVGALFYTGIYFVGDNFVLVATFLVIQAIPGNVSLMARNFLLPDVIEYSRYMTGKDCAGICASLTTFVNKLSAAIAASLGLFILGMSGWVDVEATDFADLATQAVPQTQTALDALWIIFALIPAIGIILSVVIMSFYKLKDKDIALMIKCNAGEITREECESRLSRKY